MSVFSKQDLENVGKTEENVLNDNAYSLLSFTFHYLCVVFQSLYLRQCASEEPSHGNLYLGNIRHFFGTSHSVRIQVLYSICIPVVRIIQDPLMSYLCSKALC